MDDLNADEDMLDPDERRPQSLLDSRVQMDGELSDSDDEGEGGRRNHASHRDRERDDSPSSTSLSGIGRRPSGGMGIMGAAPSMVTSTNGAGPSGHSHALPARRPSLSPVSETETSMVAADIMAVEPDGGSEAVQPADNLPRDADVIALSTSEAGEPDVPSAPMEVSNN